MKDPITSHASDKLEIHVHGPVETLNIVYTPSEECFPHPQSSDAGPVLLQGGWHTLGVIIAAISLTLAVWFLRKHLSGQQSGARDRPTHRAGRSDAVSGLALGNVLPEDTSPPHDGQPAQPHLRHGRSAAVVTADITCHHTPPPRRATVPLPRITEEPEELEEGLVIESLGTATSGGNTFQSFAAAGYHILRTWSWPPIKQVESTVACLRVPPPDPNSLRRSLHKGARDLGERPLNLGQYMFLFVGIDTPGREDAENDTEYLRQMLASPAYGSSLPRYEHLYGPNATRDKIRRTMCTLRGEAQAMSSPPRMLMLFTGTGTGTRTGTGEGNNTMCLCNNETLSERDLSDWLSECPDQTNNLAVGILFDICRIAVPPPVAISQYVEMAWSCSVGQFAYAISLSKREDKLFPRSIFLLAILLAAHHTNVHNQDSHFFEAAFTFHINQLSDLILFMYHQGHRDRCPDCPFGQQCDPPVAQNPDLHSAGDAVTNLGMLIARHFPHHAREVFVEIDRRMLKGGFPRRLCPLSDPCAERFSRPSARRDKGYLDPHMTSDTKLRFGSVASGSFP
ncbi:unnamed protein product [Rhizoctonia solani]|uniref:Uncharacterized protein n=1 Tax=Rhizoctonia solani TaxID=456999 RepID=A0A8H3CTB5_9AGAM|nr:unnamed protein product [Rhizoctonia solani]